MTANTAKHRLDYQPPTYLISQTELEFELLPAATRVLAVSQLRRAVAGASSLWLDGQDLKLTGLTVNGQDWTAREQLPDGILLRDLPEEFELCIRTEIDPAANTALEGLYLSNGAYCTQCEAEGFRRITFYPDRPDVMAVFTTHIIADPTLPFLLSNGNLIAKHQLADGRVRVSWHDPYPKPCYLFALVAGDFDELAGSYVTKSGRHVALKFYVDKGQQQQAQFALESLQRAMKFDEDVYGLEYDLDIYMVVAVDFFNMGAMENKGLNVFNSKFVLADAQTATDTDYFNIESIIAHEYFHNWTGNRVTCRDWFQLSLKEGLTVFRDQQFSAAMGSATLCRIDAIKTIRTAQFAEDAGPMAHPIRPDVVEEMNNFYTVTVYDKGAEVIRMQHTLLGAAGFRRGMDLYFQRHDGQAVTCDDFVQAMQDANQTDLSAFKRWYSQSGTPELSAVLENTAGGVSLTLRQHTPVTKDQTLKHPLLLPLRYELHDSNGQVQTGLLQFASAEQTFEFAGLQLPVIPVLLADFSAPVKFNYAWQTDELLYLSQHALDGVARWDAMQQLWSDLVRQSVQDGQLAAIPSGLLEVVRQLVRTPLSDLAFTAELLTLPGFDTLAEQYEQIPVEMILHALESYQQTLATLFAADWLGLYQRLEPAPYQYSEAQTGLRALRNTALRYLLRVSDTPDLLWQQQYTGADNMTDKLAVLQALVRGAHPQAQNMLQQFYLQHGHNVQLFDKHSALLASLATPQVFALLDQAEQLDQFDWKNPNRVRALYAVFGQQNPAMFHQADGAGYQRLASVIGKADAINPQLASRLVTPLLSFKRFAPARAALMQQALSQLQQKSLSPDLTEKLNKALHG
ncbi:MAG: aminopeptidase N [Rheinheimera sp.]|nr:aminopeptidase N [Rheinheimera sp.]